MSSQSRLSTSLLLLAVSLTLASSLAAQAPAATRSAIQQAVRAYVAASNKADASALAELYSREVGVTSIADGEITRGWDAIRSEADSIVGEADGLQVTLGSIDVTPLGPGYALATAGYTLSIRTARGEARLPGAMTVVFRRIGSEWKIIHDHTSTQGLSDSAADAETPSGNTMEATYVASMKSDLRNLVTAEEAYFADSVRYTATVGRGGINFVVTRGNTTPIVTLTRDGWTATIGNVNTRTRCAIFVGSTPIPPAMKEGYPACR